MKKRNLLLMLLLAIGLPWVAKAQETLTVCDGTAPGTTTGTNCYSPVNSYYTDTQGATSEFIIASTTLGMDEITGGTITKLTFYIPSHTDSWGTPTIQVYMGEVEATTLSSLYGPTNTNVTIVSESVWDNTQSTIELNLTTPYTYQGGNLLIGTYVKTASSWEATYFSGITAPLGSSRYNNGSGSGSAVSFLPKTTFTYAPGTTPYITLAPTSATVITGSTQSLTANYGNVSGTPTITYTTNNTSVATVSGNGATATVTAVAPGTATITATMNGSYTATCAITVEDPSYCTPNPSSVDGKGITALTFGSGSNVVNNSNSNGLPASSPYYGDYTSMVGSIEAGETATVTITYSTGTYTVYSYGTIIWVDWNKNYEFEDGEIVYTGTSAQGSNGTPQVLTATFTVPATQAADNYRMRIAGADSYFDSYIGGNTSANHSPCFTSDYAVCHDYTLNVTAASPFQKPTDLEVSNITASGATVSWQAPSSATPTGYEYMYKEASSSDWPTNWTGNQGQLSVALTGLSAGTAYDVRVRANYTEGNSEPAEISFRTTVDANQIVNTVSDPATQMTWSQFVNYWNNGAQFTSTTFTLMNDITITEMVGTTENPFSGTFDGNGRTITLNYNATESFCAPFRYVRNATIQNLAVGGTIETANQFAGGFVGDCFGNNTLTNCLSNVTINSTKSGDGTHGGFIGRNSGGGTVNLTGCAFTGSLLGTETTSCAGLVGWTENGYYGSSSHTIFTNCVFAPAEVTIGTSSSYTFSRIYTTSGTPVTFNNCYYTETFGTAQGKEMLYIIPDGNFPNITVEMVGTPTNYSLSGIDAYSPGIVYENVIYAGQDETVTLALGGSQTGYYKSIYGTLTPSGDNYTLRMAGYSTSIIELCPAPEGLAISNVTAHTATISWTVEEGVNYEYYISNNIGTPTYSSFTPVTSSPIQLDDLTAETEYYVYVIRKCYEGSHSQILAPTTFTTAISCPAPTQFAASDITNHTATLSWQGTSTSYTVQYRTAAGEDAPFKQGFENGLGSWTFTSMNTANAIGTSYGAGVLTDAKRSGNYGFRFSSWSSSTQGYDQYLITPELNYTGNFKFYYRRYSTSWTEKFKVGYSTTTNDLSSFTWGSEITAENTSYSDDVYYEEALPNGTKYVAIYYCTGACNSYLYIDDITIGAYEIAAGEWQNATVEGTTANLSGLFADRDYEATVQGDCGEVDGQSTVVSTTFTTDLPCPDPTNLQVVENSLKSDRVTLSWDSDYAEAWTVAFKAEDDADFTETMASENPFTLQGLTEETTYTVKVRSNCGSADGPSTGWSNEVTFTTTEACVVMDVAVNDVTHYAATVTWTGDNKDEDNPGFTVSYRTAQQIDGVEENFNGSSITWEIYGGQLQADGTATLSSASGWRITTYAFGNNNATCNIFGTGCFRWIVTPTVTLPQGSALNFDMALTDYGNSDVIETPTSQADDRFVVLVSTNGGTNWTILREWNNAEGTTYVYNSIATTGEHVNIDLSAYNGQTVKIAFYGESTASGGDNDLHIDNVTIGTPVAAGTWQTVSAANDASSANLSGLTAGTKYDVKVAPNCDATLESDVLQFTTVSPNEKWFITEGNWGMASNWEPTGVPTIDQNVTLLANATVESGCVAEAKSIAGTGTSADAKTLTIKDGGKLKYLNSDIIVRATVEKEIRPYSPNYDVVAYNNGDYYLITNPLSSEVTPSEANGFLVGDYDLYSWNYNATDGNEWRNYKANEFSNLMYGAYGYLYANKNGTTLTYTGDIYPYISYKSRYAEVASSPEDYDFPGWYLYGNPYMYDAYLANSSSNGTALPYIKMNTTGDGFTNVAAGTPIEPMEGFFYQQATTSGSVYVVTYEPAATNNGKLNMNLRSNNKQLDNAILVFGGEQQLGKMTFRANSSKIFMPVEGKDYAITSVEGQVGEVPVSFKAENNGTYSLSFTSEEVSFSYLHLIDNMTGNDVNLLANPTYSFDARTSDYESRFRLVFATGSSTGSDTFGFVNASGNFCIFGIEGEATVQVIDILGHVISSETFSGSYEKRINGAPGVYMVRLIQGNDVKIQKVVVR